jgi:adenylylsulfate kinase
VTIQKATNIKWHHATITAEDRVRLNGHSGAVLWFTGLSSSGKSTLACAVEAMLFERGIHTYVLDGDNIRHGLNKNLGFSPADRTENIRRIGEVAHLFADAGVIALTAFISPYLADRDSARKMNPPGKFVEIYCKCPIEVCESRDPKGLYKKARAGQLKEFTGIDAPYEVPTEPEIVVDTSRDSLEKCAAKVLGHLEANGLIPKI